MTTIDFAGLSTPLIATERAQAEQIRAGRTLRQQTAFDDYLFRRAQDPGYTFRAHLCAIGGAIEE